MSGSDQKDQPSGSEPKRKKRKRRSGTWVAPLALVVLIIVVSAMLAGFLEPYPKRAILKANEMTAVTGLNGQWEQTSLHCFEHDITPPYSSRQAAHSIMNFDNDTSHLTVAITVAEMETDEQANRTYDQWASYWSGSSVNNILMTVGEEGLLSGFLEPGGTYDGSAYLHFRKGAYVVEIYFSGNIIMAALFEQIGRNQAARL